MEGFAGMPLEARSDMIGTSVLCSLDLASSASTTLTFILSFCLVV